MSNIFDEIRFPSAADGVQIYKMFIDGKWVESSNQHTFNVHNPDDFSIVGKVQKASKNDALWALDSAFNTKAKIAGMSSYERAQILEKTAKLLSDYKTFFVDTIVAEAGKPVKVAEGEVDATIERFKFAAEEAKELKGEAISGDSFPHTKKKIAMTRRQPLGVVLAISPFNYPLFIASAKIAPAIAAGNAVISKPASDDPICLIMLAKLLQIAGMPDGTFNVVSGSSAEIGDILVESEKVDMISFTGSSEVGIHIAKAAGMKKIHMELGGKSPGIVLEDADLDLAAKECISGALKYSGQRCDAISRILVVESVADEFTKKILAELPKWKLGSPKNADISIGPIINQKALEKIDALVNDAVEKGAHLFAGGKKVRGLYFEPTVLGNVTKDMRIAWEETFGPVVSIIRVKDYEEALRMANESQYGLDASIFTNDLNRALDGALKLIDGTVQINAAPMHGVGTFPFGGDKYSGIGREGIRTSMEEMTKIHTIVFNLK
ncbi:MAG: aldehyde dehydrogenase family protein [Nanoarchaeota archaeon]|nr:aldehyde dehydrogenase family protein [Nanoarchaeota archaeon]MBU4299921.1 aldehyde dehydrogenase family protein [Nanoarchaeota archaeon]MBU4451661.1 aldehyde dehydrogenase family protein [Nanoarchaeota archaeon]MCG2724576.1 aldehyde dehydrogenase family protein [archaeon]